jgi:beta-phosphoglucomutase
MYKGVLFDAEGVVIDTEPIWDIEQSQFLQKRKIKYERDKIKHLVTGRSIVEGTKLLQEMYDLEGYLPNLVEERKNTINNLFSTKISFVNGFKEFHERIRKKFKICIATSMDISLLNEVDKKLSLRNLFGEKVFSIKDVGMKSKPDPAIFLYSAKKLELDPSECVVIEDAPHGNSNYI